MTILAQAHPAYVPTSRERAELVLGQLEQLPTLPALAVKLLTVTSANDSSAHDVVELIEADAAMTAAVLKRLQRADLGIRADGLTVERAVTLLGFTAVRNLVFSLQLYGAFKKPGQDSKEEDIFRELWRHNLAVACASELIAGFVDRPRQGEAFICGLLHDLGKIALDIALPKSFARVVQTAAERSRCICDVEREALGIDHTVVGKQLASRWGLPDSVIECAWLHHHDVEALPASLVAPTMVRIVHLADDIVRREGIGLSGYQHVGDIEEQAHQLELTLARLRKVVYQLPDRMRPTCELIGLDEPVDPEATAAALSMANLRLGQLNEKINEANRRLEIRSACLTTVERFADKLSVHDHVTDVGRTAAQCVKGLLSAAGGMTFFEDESAHCVYISQCEGAADVRPLVFMGDRDGDQGMAGSFSDHRNLPVGFVRAGASLQQMWSHYQGAGCAGNLYALPLHVHDRCVGAIVVDAKPKTVNRFRNATSECNILSTTFGLALASAAERAHAERTSEEFAELHRRYQEMQIDRVRNRTVSMLAAMAAGAAHELNNPLSVISGRTQMMLTEFGDDASRQALESVVLQTEKATGIVNELIAFAKPATPSPDLFALGDFLKKLHQRWQLEYGAEGAEFVLSVADAEITVFADPHQLQTVFDKIVVNAIEAAGDEPLRVEINSPSRVSDETVRIVVKDNGVGMTREVLDHAIDPFFSSRPAGRGRGMGLSHAYRLTEINGGRLWLESQPKSGTTVTIELPTHAPTEENVDAGEQPEDPAG